jgi:hypothetical protein
VSRFPERGSAGTPPTCDCPQVMENRVQRGGDVGSNFRPDVLPYDTRDLQIQKYLTSIGSNGVYYTRPRSNVELALDLPSLKVKDAAVGTVLHEFAESYFPQYLAYRGGDGRNVCSSRAPEPASSRRTAARTANRCC